jgi:hypothetical protein
MSRIVLLAALAATPLLAPAAPAPQSSCPNVWFHEPLVVYDITGATFAGPFDRHLVVHGNGIAKLSSSTHGSGPGKARTEYLAPADARALAIQLAAMGGMTLCDEPTLVVDSPLKTLTLLRGTTDAPAHTFSWYDTVGPYLAIEQAMNDFITKHFPGF